MSEPSQHALHWAVWREDEPRVKQLLADNVDVNHPYQPDPGEEDAGYVVLHEEAGRAVIACPPQMTISVGGVVVYETPRWSAGSTALHVAVLRGNAPLASFLLDDGAAVDARDTSGYSPLHYAAFGDRPYEPIIRLLLGRGADVNAHDDHGATPLDLAHDPFIWYLLLEAGGMSQFEAEEEETD